MTNEKLVSYAKMVVTNHEGEREEVKRRIAFKLLEKFRSGNDEMKRAVSAIMNAEDILFSELNIIIAESEQGVVNE